MSATMIILTRWLGPVDLVGPTNLAKPANLIKSANFVKPADLIKPVNLAKSPGVVGLATVFQPATRLDRGRLANVLRISVGTRMRA